MKKIGYGLFVFILAIVFSFGSVAQAEKKELTFGVVQWTDCMMLPRIAKYVLEEKFGYQIKEVEFFEWGIAFAALEKGNIDVLLSLVNFCAEDYWKRSKDKGEKIGVPSFGMDMGMVVPAYVPINSIAELNDNKDLFGGEIIGIEAGSGLMRQTRQVMEGYKLDYELLEGSSAAMFAATSSAYAKKKPILVTHWIPSWQMQKFDLKFLKDPKGIQQGAQAYHFLGRKGFSKEFPFAREVISGIFVHIDHINQVAMWEDEGKSNAEAVKMWLELPASQKLVDRWSVVGVK